MMEKCDKKKNQRQTKAMGIHISWKVSGALEPLKASSYQNEKWLSSYRNVQCSKEQRDHFVPSIEPEVNLNYIFPWSVFWRLTSISLCPSVSTSAVVMNKPGNFSDERFRLKNGSLACFRRDSPLISIHNLQTSSSVCCYCNVGIE